MNHSLSILLTLFFAVGCQSTKPSFEHNFCYVDINNLVCSELQADGQYANVDRAFTEVKNFKGYVLIPVEDFENGFSH